MSTDALFWALKARVGNPYRKLILIVLADISNEQDQCWPSHDYIANLAECKRRSVIEHLSALEASGFIKIEHRFTDKQQRPNMYTLLTDGVRQMHSGGVHEMHKGGAPNAHNTPIDTPKHICSESWAEWVAYRKQARKPMTPKTVEKQFAMLSQYDMATQKIIINTSIEKGWAGLFPPKEQNHADTKKPVNGYSDTRRLSRIDEVRAARERARDRHSARPSDMGGVDPLG